MKVIAINGSPRKNGNTGLVLRIMADELEQQGIEVETIQIGHLNIHGCIHCEYCRQQSPDNLCVFTEDIVNETALKMRTADGFILASPTYYAGIAGTMKSMMDRIFHAGKEYFRFKVATSAATVRRAGGVDTVHQLNNYLNLAQTVIPPSQYWTIAYGMEEGEALQDPEGIQTLRKNARAMAWLLQVIEAGKSQVSVPDEEERIMTNFIR